MCGRYGHTNPDKEKIKKAYRLKEINFELIPRYNISPGQDVNVILNEHPNEMNHARWGLVPSWSKDEKTAYKMINARCETVFEKPAYRSCIKKKRCLILADCFYEWQQPIDVKGKKQPYCIRLKSQESFAFAGIWDLWEAGGNALVSCSIITCGPNNVMKSIHDRMPVILTGDQQQKWLSEQYPDEVRKMLSPFQAKLMEAFKISTLVNSPTFQGQEIVKPI